MITCSWKSHFGIECPGCGFQRSFVELIHGNFTESLLLFPALIPLLLTFTILILHLIYKFNHGAKWITYSFALSAILMFSSLVVKLVNI